MFILKLSGIQKNVNLKFTLHSVPSTSSLSIMVCSGITFRICWKVRLQIELSFLYCSPFSYRSSNFAIAKLSLLIPLLQFLYKFCRLFMASFLYCFPYSYRSSNYCDSNSFRSFKLLAKSKSTHIVIAFKSEKEQ